MAQATGAGGPVLVQVLPGVKRGVSLKIFMDGCLRLRLILQKLTLDVSYQLSLDVIQCDV